MKFSTKYLLQAASVAVLALSFSAGHAQPSSGGWPAKWPSSLDGNARLEDDLVKTDYTPEEKRNIMTVLNDFSDESRAAWLKNPHRAPHEGFPGLDKYYGSHDFDEAKSIPDRKDRIIDLIAKGNRVGGAFVITGHHQGEIYGFKGDGKPVQILEFFFRTFDADGHTTDVVYRGEELQLYVAMGGKVEFPKDGIAAQIASNPPPPPPGAGPGGPRQRPHATPWTTWPPAQWPASVSDNPKLVKYLTETQWTDQEKHIIQDTIDTPPAPQRAPMPRHTDLTVQPDCGISCPNGRHGFDFIDELSGFHGYFPATSVPDRVEVVDDMIVKGDRVWRWFVGHGHQSGYFYGFPGDGHPIEWREIEFGGLTTPNGLGVRSEELQLYASMGGKLQFPGKPKVP